VIYTIKCFSYGYVLFC